MSKPQNGLEKPKLTFIQKCKTMRGQQMVCTVTFLIVPLLLLFTFTYLPFFKMVQFSFYDRDYLRVRDFVGLRNYLDVFSRSDCFQALKLSLYYMVGSVFQNGLALLFATILSFKVRGSKFFRGALYFPCLICVLVGSVMISAMLAYVLNRFQFHGNSLIRTLFTIATLIPGIASQVTVYQIMDSLHLVNTMHGYIILIITIIPALIIFLLCQDQIYSGLAAGAVKG